MSLTVAISAHEGYASQLRRAVDSALLFADEVVVYADGPLSVKPDCRCVELPKSEKCIAARQVAVHEAETDWLLHLDADDWLHARPPEAEADIVFSDLLIADETSVRLSGRASVPTTVEGLWDFLLRTRGMVCGRNPLPVKPVYRVKWLHDNGLTWYRWPRTVHGDDVRTLIEYLQRDPRMAYVPGAAYYVYRSHEEQASRDAEEERLFCEDLDVYLGR